MEPDGLRPRGAVNRAALRVMVRNLAWGVVSGMSTGEEQDLRQILVAMQHSLTQIDGKIDSISYRMDRMTECLDKHAERLDQSERGRLCSLEQELAQLEQEHLHGADSRAGGHIHTKLIEFQDTAFMEIQHLEKYATARAYGDGERAGSVLANLIRPSREKSMIIAVQAEDGSEIRDPERIVARFCDYYDSIYASKVAPDQEALMDYLAHIDMPRLTGADRCAMQHPLMEICNPGIMCPMVEGPLDSHTTGQLNDLGHNGDSLGADSAHVGVFSEPDLVGLAELVQGHDCRTLVMQNGLEVLQDLLHQALEGLFADEQLRGLLLAADLAESDSPGLVVVRLLDSTNGRSALARSLCVSSLGGAFHPVEQYKNVIT
ncbi:hypothetical protein NDU88_001741 [Pleurodeles waltl]|uniref:Uncharacterized protein n=1 Tax=Pleurodeles waltl TaxID=8319 RepID=A0AAV7Q4K1_PLEWA|nr:hypothetical protein NDU88_001741 [Pleurodeles waltl]